MNEDNILFAIPLYSQTEESYRIKWEKTFQKAFSLNQNDRTDKEIEEFRSFQLSRDPNFYRYNDIVGYAELAIDYKNIFIYYHMNGDLRHIFNKDIERFRGSKKIYRGPRGTWGSSFTNIDNRSIRRAVVASLKSIEKQSKDWKIIANINPYIEKIQHFNFKKYLTNKNYEL